LKKIHFNKSASNRRKQDRRAGPGRKLASQAWSMDICGLTGN